MSRLIADCGSTKCDWTWVTDSGDIIRFESSGIHAASASPDEALTWLKKVFSSFTLTEMERIYFFGAGCNSESAIASIKHAFNSRFARIQSIEVHSDIRAAYLASSPKIPAFICILGTGTNVQFFDGKTLHPVAPSLGYILGDEGSGADLGKYLIKGMLRKSFHSDLTERFFKETKHTSHSLITEVYRAASPNRFMASFVPFLVAHKEDNEVQHLLKERFEQFLLHHLSPGRHLPSTKLFFVGSIASLFYDELKAVVVSHGYEMVQCIQKPMEGLIEHFNIKR